MPFSLQGDVTMLKGRLREGLTFDDVLLIPAKSEVLPSQVDVSTFLTPQIGMSIPLISAAMDTVTEARLAIGLAQEGGVGIVHRNMSIEDQVSEVDKVKRSESGMIVDPITMSPEQSVREALDVMEQYRISGIPITKNGRLVGILTNRDLRFVTDLNKKISELMTKDKLVTAPEGTTLDAAKELLHQHRIEKLPVVDDRFRLKGLITIKDIEKRRKYPRACKDQLGRLVVGAAVGVSADTDKRVKRLVQADVDVIVVDTAHGHALSVLKTVEKVKKDYPSIALIGGNVATTEATLDLINAGCDAVKVGIGPSSICTTRVVAGIGVPQLTAVSDCAEVGDKFNIPIIADGGIRYSGDITKALAAGARSVMIGSIFAGTDESPGEKVLYQGRAHKAYRGMGSLGAMQEGSSDRYFQSTTDGPGKLVPEGVEGLIPFKGSLSSLVHQLVGGLRAGMGYCGCATIEELRLKSRFIKISPAALRESHVHDVTVTKEAPNYQVED
jgi:IMP dehydrogenase